MIALNLPMKVRGGMVCLVGGLALAVGVYGCKDDTDPEPGLEDNFGVVPDQGVEGCDNLVEACLYPFPSNAYVVDGRLQLPPEGMPESANGSFDPGEFTRFEAFGAASPVLFQLPGAVPADEDIFDPEPWLADDSPILLIDASTGERLPHWVESDFFASELDPPLFTIRPSIALPRGTEIVVGVRNLTDADGNVVDAPEAFAALRDQTAARHFGIHERRAHYEDVVFPTLEAAGMARDELQLAWSFPVRTDESATRRMLAVRDAIFAELPASGPEYSIDSVVECPGLPDDPEGCHPAIRLIVDGTSFVPSVMGPADERGARRIVEDEAGNPVVGGVEAWPWRLQIPHSAYEGDAPVPVMQYGHGFLGSIAESNNGWLRDFAERKGVAILATSMQGMNEADAAVWIAVLLGEGGDFPFLAELAMQGVTNQLVQQRMVKTSLAEDPLEAFYRDDGQLAWDPETVWYHGNSQGGSVGTVVMGIATDVTRADLGVPGSGYPFLLHRSSVFEPFALLIEAAYPEPDGISRFLATLGTGWDDFDPLTFSPHIHGNPLPGTPDHEAIFHVAKEDRQVHNEASFISGRTAGAVLMTPTPRPVWGLVEETYPASPGVAVIEVDFGIPEDDNPLDPPPGVETLPNGGDTHGWLRRWEPAQDQMVHFFETGELIDVCGGQPCFNDGAP